MPLKRSTAYLQHGKWLVNVIHSDRFRRTNSESYFAVQPRVANETSAYARRNTERERERDVQGVPQIDSGMILRAKGKEEIFFI